MQRRLSHILSLAGAVLLMGAASTAVQAQGKGHGHEEHGHEGHVPPGQAKKHVTVGDAYVVTRDVLVKHGYEVVRYEEHDGVRVVYYRRGSRGRGHGRGPVEKMIIRPSRERVVFEAAPEGVLVDINIRLGF
jgi:catechol 2,3-dioxygenase-like lactoylglutathione lyase family enzyme